MKVTVYVDGSFNEERQTYGGGIVILNFPGQDGALQIKTVGNKVNMLTHRNISGEILAVCTAFKLCMGDASIDEMDIYYDYAGIEYWATGKWQAKKPISQLYTGIVRQVTPRMKLHFHHVKAHSGDTYNTLADKLAREATYMDATEGEA